MERQKFTELGFCWARSQQRFSLKPFSKNSFNQTFWQDSFMSDLDSLLFLIAALRRWVKAGSPEKTEDWRRCKRDPPQVCGNGMRRQRLDRNCQAHHIMTHHAIPCHATPFHTIPYNLMHHAIDNHTNLCNYRPTVKLLTVRGMHRQSKEEEVPILHISIFWPLTLNMFQNLLFANQVWASGYWARDFFWFGTQESFGKQWCWVGWRTIGG